MGESQRRLRDTIVPAHVWWVHRYLSFGSSANNHRLGELTGLLIAVKRWPELERIAGNAEKLWDQIADCVLAQFAEDGGNREQALHYHLFAFEMALHACRAMNVNSGPVVERLQHAAAFFVRMSHPQEPWDYGDSDDAQIVPMTMRRDKAVAEWCAWMSNTAAEVGGAPKNAATALDYWIGDSSVRNPLSSIRNRDWWIAKESGMAVIERDGWKVRVDASPLGFGKMAAHGHCDALHVSIWDGEHALVIDPGTGGYFGSKELRAELASWNAHNGPQPVEGFKTPRRVGMFLCDRQHEKPRAVRDAGWLRTSMRHEEYHFSRAVKVEDGEVVIEDFDEQGRSFIGRLTFNPQSKVSEHLSGPSTLAVDHVAGKIKWLIKIDGCDNMLLSNAVSSRVFGFQEECPVVAFHCKNKTVTRIKRVTGSYIS